MTNGDDKEIGHFGLAPFRRQRTSAETKHATPYPSSPFDGGFL
jgi:hypothetical protein